jgi:predicted signal transduction protein with EAL and GGDEF domain
MPISNRNRDITFSMVMYQLGVPTNPRAFVLTNLLISACVALPTGVIASQHEFRLKNYQRRLEALAATDPLTGLYNRRFFKQALEDEVQRMRRTHQTAGLVIFDLDHFKCINDRFGHKSGDLVLQEVASAAFAM